MGAKEYEAFTRRYSKKRKREVEIRFTSLGASPNFKTVSESDFSEGEGLGPRRQAARAHLTRAGVALAV